MKKIVVYYSFGGNTRTVARRIARETGADIAEIRTVKTYPDDYDVLLSLGKREVESGCIPQLYPLPADIKEYGCVILGTPVWWYTFAPAVRSFLKTVDWKGKKVYPFATNGGWLGHTPSDFRKALKGATVAPVLSIRFDEKTLVTSEEAIRNWIKTIE